jgi:hypothetical protein
MLRHYVNEVPFYGEMQRRGAIATPRCYHADSVGEGPHFALLLGDLAPAKQGDRLHGCSAAVARAAVLELVGLHAPSWCDESLRGIGWLGEPDAADAANLRALYREHLAGFLDRYGDRLEAAERAIIAAVGDSSGAPFGGLPNPLSAIHID